MKLPNFKSEIFKTWTNCENECNLKIFFLNEIVKVFFVVAKKKEKKKYTLENCHSKSLSYGAGLNDTPNIVPQWFQRIIC